MRKIMGIAAIILLVSGYATAADFWHFGVGLRATGVMPSNDSLYANALGVGVLLTFGDPDSRFTTQVDLDAWSVEYTKDGEVVEDSPIGTPDSAKTYRLAQYEYSGMGVGFLGKFRAYDFSNTFSTYIIGGLGGYFLDLKRERRNDDGSITVKSNGFHSLIQYAGGVGLEGRLSQHFSSFIEGRYVGVISGDDSDPYFLKGYVGVRYVF